MPEPKNRATNRPPKHEHPSVACYRKLGCKCIEGSDEKHEGWEECREANTTWAREHRRKTHPQRGSANAQRRTTKILDEDELMRLRKQVGLI